MDDLYIRLENTERNSTSKVIGYYNEGYHHFLVYSSMWIWNKKKIIPSIQCETSIRWPRYIDRNLFCFVYFNVFNLKWPCWVKEEISVTLHTHAKANLIQTNKFPVSQTRVGLVVIYTRNIVKSCLITQYWLYIVSVTYKICETLFVWWFICNSLLLVELQQLFVFNHAKWMNETRVFSVYQYVIQDYIRRVPRE
jgi:hypothetical protein